MKPDQGYAWVVLVACILNGALLAMAYAINGVFILEYSQKYGVTSDVIMWVGALRMAVFGFSGLLTGQIVHRFGSRTTGVLGSILIVFCDVVSSVYTNIYFLYFTYGIISGLGYSCISVSSTVAAQQYFDKRRALAGGLLLAGSSVGTLIFPPLINYLYSEYGLQGTILLEAGIVLQGVVVSMLFRPFVPDKEIEKDTKVPSDFNIYVHNEWTSMPTLVWASNSMEILSCSNENLNTHSSLSDISHRPNKKHVQKSESDDLLKKVLCKTPNDNFIQRENAKNLENGRESDDLLKKVLCKTPNGTNIKAETIREPERSYKPVLNSQSNHENFIQRENVKNLENVRESRPLCEVLHNEAFMVASIGAIFAQAGHLVPFSLIPLKGVEIGASRENAALLLSIVGISNIFLRGLGGFVSDFKIIAPRRVLFSAITYVMSGGLHFVASQTDTFVSVAVVAALWGCLCSYYVSISGTIVRDLVGGRLLSVAFGVHLSLYATGWFPVMIGSGYLLTKTGRSLEAYILCGACQILGGLLIGVAHFMLQNRRQKGDSD